MRLLILKNMMSVSIVSLIFFGDAMAKPIAENFQNSSSRVQLTKNGTTNVEKKLMWLVDGLQEDNPPDGNPNFPQMLPESDMPDEQNLPIGNEMSVSEPHVDEVDSHINKAEDPGATPTHFKTNATVLKGNSVRSLNIASASFVGNPVPIKPDFISATDKDLQPVPADPKPVPQDPYDPTNEGTSKEGRHKEQHLHQQGGSIHLIPIIRMGENSQESSGLTVVKPWSS